MVYEKNQLGIKSSDELKCVAQKYTPYAQHKQAQRET